MGRNNLSWGEITDPACTCAYDYDPHNPSWGEITGHWHGGNIFLIATHNPSWGEITDMNRRGGSVPRPHNPSWGEITELIAKHYRQDEVS